MTHLDESIKTALGPEALPLDMTELLSKYGEEQSQLEKRVDTLYSVLHGIVKPPDLTADTEKFIAWLKEHRGIMDPTTIDLEDLEGTEADFYGVDGNCFKLDDDVYEVIEDEFTFTVVKLAGKAAERPGFSPMPVARVVIEHEDDGWDNRYNLTDLHDEHCWLRFGMDDYTEYPVFIFETNPDSDD